MSNRIVQDVYRRALELWGHEAQERHNREGEKMHGKPSLYIDQYGQMIYAKSARELREKCGGGHLFKIYCDTKMGETMHVGYGVGNRWFVAYQPETYPTK